VIDHGCPRCQALWRDYAKATVEHNRLIREHEKAAGKDVNRFCDLDRLTDDAGAERAAARTRIQLHMRLAHSTRSAGA